MSASHISNRLQSLVLDIGQSFVNPLNSEDEKQSQLLDDDNTKQYDSVQQLILSEDSLIAIFRHPLFKQSTNKELHTKIYKLIIAKADDDSISSQILQIMQELHSNKNYMSSLANQISQTLKWTRKLKALKSKALKSNAPKPRVESSDDEDSEQPRNTNTHFNPPQNDSSSSDSTSSSCYYSDEEQNTQTKPTKPPIKEATYSAINNKRRKRNNRRKKKRKEAQNKKNGDIMESRDYEHNFDQFSSASDSLSDKLSDINIHKDQITEPSVPPNKKACTHCTFHNELTAKKCQMCGNTFKYKENNTNKKRGRKRNRKPKFWQCKQCQSKNKNVAGQCKCGKMKEIEDYEWQCKVCTTINHINLNKCKSCDEKPSQKQKSKQKKGNNRGRRQYHSQRQNQRNNQRQYPRNEARQYQRNNERQYQRNEERQYQRNDERQRRYKKQIQIPLNNDQQYNEYHQPNGPRIPPLSHNRDNRSTPPPSSSPWCPMDKPQNHNMIYPADNEDRYEFYGPQRDQKNEDNEPSTPPPQSSNNNNNNNNISWNALYN